MTFALVALILCLVLLALVAYPYVGYPLILARLKPRQIARAPEPASDGAEFALLFCTYNEAASMPEKIDNLRTLLGMYPNLEVQVYDDKSSDETVELIENSGLNITLIRGAGRQGKAHGMKTLVAHTARPFLVFTDANVLIDQASLIALKRSYGDPAVGGVCGKLIYLENEETSTEVVGGAYWRLEERIKTLESRSGSVMGADGSIFSVRRALYPDFVDSVQDDFTVSMSVVFQQKRLISDTAVIAYERLVSARQIEVRRKVRIATRAYHTHRQMRPQLRRCSTRDRFCYVSHKLLRWFGGYFLALSAAFAVLAAAILSPLGAVLFLGLLGAGIYIASRARRGPLASGYEILISIMTTAVGVARAARGETMATWTPPRAAEAIDAK